MYVKVEFFCIESKSKQSFEKSDMHIIIMLSQQPLRH
jgi:hypothetical protein